MESTLWIEKYRPGKFEDMIGQEEIISRAKAFAESGNMPHLLLTGPPGVGKTTLSLIIAKQLYKDFWKNNILELNASSERGIDVVRNNIKNFARTKSIGEVPFKICILDEADSLTKEAQQALRRTMETYSSTCRFILLANYSSKIIEPIQSRCSIFRFKPLPKEKMLALIDRISASEGLSVDAKGKEALLESSEGDCRRLENIMQSCGAVAKNITEEVVYSLVSAAKPKEIKEIIRLALEGHFIQSRSKLTDTMLNYGLSGIDVIKQIQKETVDLEIENSKKLSIIEKCGETEFRMTEGSDEYIQLEALLSHIALSKQKNI